MQLEVPPPHQTFDVPLDDGAAIRVRRHGKPEEKRLHCHGQGYDMVERPLLRFDETMPLASNMVMSAHPSYSSAGSYNWVCDNFLLGDSGVVEKLHQLPQKIYELG